MKSDSVFYHLQLLLIVEILIVLYCVALEPVKETQHIQPSTTVPWNAKGSAC